ncbi:MAG: 50S ribosomal protein L4 [Pelagibacteraceae bacterium]|jgi:large subunit ribosomal protein L4|uniref:50S ribosomal protein L4 n=1 Tax=unclassified Candidatus Pelagibacter TaxID=2647897 RepID=UPI00256C570E|nr:50S ribosomal protein L4 [Pelagibacteraceae bacterium]MCI5079315.1 50S ribosomal protein L4 [Pelagibacteraceae bacterium]|tara:strand:- start:1298 stop:1927 length:630 start_codon:yes stop_codon:yes gene_type:complete
MKINEISIDGKNVGSLEASDKVFKVKPRKDIIQQVIDWQQNRMFKKTGHTKSRGEVKGSRKKIVQQKGSGGARHGNITAPIFVGGGIAHGPRHRGNYAVKKLNKKVRKLGLVHALSVKAKSDQIAIFNEPKMSGLKTKNFKDFLKNIKSKSALFIHHKDAPKEFVRSIKNIPNSKKLEDVGTNVYDLIKYEKVLFTKESFKAIEERLNK